MAKAAAIHISRNCVSGVASGPGWPVGSDPKPPSHSEWRQRIDAMRERAERGLPPIPDDDPDAEPDLPDHKQRAAEHESQLDSDDRLRFVIVVAPRCPKCGGMKLKVYGSTMRPDGTRLRYTLCKTPDCGHTFQQIVYQ